MRFRATAWRAPSKPRERACCVCGAAAPCEMNGAAYCVADVPEGFWPKRPEAPKVEDVGDVI